MIAQSDLFACFYTSRVSIHASFFYFWIRPCLSPGDEKSPFKQREMLKNVSIGLKSCCPSSSDTSLNT